MQKTYNGNDIFKNFNAGLYQYDDIDFQQSKDNILIAFKSKYQDIISDTLKLAGLEYIDLTYFSPRQYNYLNDSIDITISILDIKKLSDYIQSHKSDIQKLLNNNKSYDGYIALTPDDISDLKPDDITIIQSILSDIDFSDFDISEYFTYTPDDDDDN